jgi:hypothetical protein
MLVLSAVSCGAINENAHVRTQHHHHHHDYDYDYERSRVFGVERTGGAWMTLQSHSNA